MKGSHLGLQAVCSAVPPLPAGSASISQAHCHHQHRTQHPHALVQPREDQVVQHGSKVGQQGLVCGTLLVDGSAACQAPEKHQRGSVTVGHMAERAGQDLAHLRAWQRQG